MPTPISPSPLKEDEGGEKRRNKEGEEHTGMGH